MSQPGLHRAIQAELAALTAEGLLTREERARISPRYPTGKWDVLALIRWFTILGAVTAAAGIAVLLRHVVDFQNAIDFGLGLATVAAVGGGLWLERRRGLLKTGAALQLLGGLALQGLIVALAIRFSTGSKNWPLLVWVCTAATGALAYALPNRLVLIQALVNAFIAFGGSTGYESGWGMYWLGMDYPTRFILAGLAALGLAWGHAQVMPGARKGFSRVWAHFGLLSIHLALWFFALFGYFDGTDNFRWEGKEAERLLFSALWAGVAVTCLFAGSKIGLRLIRGYGLTFLIINLYTFYFQFIAAKSGELWFVHLLLVGGSMVAGGVWLERRLARKPRGAEAPQP